MSASEQASLVLNQYESGRRLAEIWRQQMVGVAYIPLPASEVRAQFEQMAADAIAVLLAVAAPPAVVRARARAIASQLVSLGLSSSLVLEETLALLAEHLPLVVAGESDYQPSRLGLLLAGLAGGFAEETDALILSHQESIRRAYTVALRAGNDELEAQRDHLARAIEALSLQIGERERAEEVARVQTARLERLHQVSLGVLAADTLTKLIDTAIRFIQETFGCLHAGLGLFDESRRQSTVFHSSNSGHFASGDKYPVTMQQELAAVRAGGILYIPDILARDVRSPGYQRMVEIGGRSLLVVPVGSGPNFAGALSIIMGEVREFTPDEVAIVQDLCNLLAVAIQNRMLLEAEQQARQREATLREVATNLSFSLNLDEFLDRVLSSLNQVIQCDSSSIVLIEGGKPLLVAQRPQLHVPGEWFEAILTRNPDSMSWVLRTGRPRLINDTTSVETWVFVPGAESVRSWVGVPLLIKGTCIGALTLDRDEVGSFTSQDVDLAMAFATQAAVAIENARLFAQVQTQAEILERRVQERTRELHTLYGIAAAAVESPNLDSVLHRSLELTIDVFGCCTGAIYLRHDGDRDARLAGCLDLSGRDLAHVLAEPGLVDELLRRLPAAGVPWISDDDDIPALLHDKSMGSLAVAGLHVGERRLGALCLLSDAPGRLVEASPLLTAIADQIGLAVENIDLRQKTRQAAINEERERLARELHDAVTQSIYGIGLFANAARDAARAGDLVKAEQHVRTVQQTSRRALKEMRLLLFELRTESLARLGLAGALEDRLKTVERAAYIQAELQVKGVGSLTVAVEETLFRIALEALNNSLRHAQAQHVVVSIRARQNRLIMIVRDDGVGFSVAAGRAKGGMGLSSMESRVSKVGGTLKITSKPGAGTHVEVRVPLIAIDNRTDVGRGV